MAGEGATALGRAARRATEQAERKGRKVPRHVQQIAREAAQAAGVDAPTAPTGRRVWPYVVGGGVAAGTAGLVAYRHASRKKDAVTKGLVAVPVGKRERDTGRGAATGALIGAGSVPVTAGATHLVRVARGKPGLGHPAIGGARLSAGTTAALYGIETAARTGLGAGVGALVGRKKREVGKAAYSQDGTNVLRLTARTPDGRFVSHANDLCVVHVTPRRNPTSRLLQVGKSASSVDRMAQVAFRTPKRVSKVPKPAAQERFFAARVASGKPGAYGRSVGRKLAG